MVDQIEKSIIPIKDHGGHGSLITFVHANGYPPGCYEPLITRLLNQHKVISIIQRPLWKNSKPEDIDDWYILSEDLIHFLDQQGIKSTIAIGHSLGAVVSLRAAIKYPDRFKALIILDPVIFPPILIRLIRMFRNKKLLYRFHPLIKAASRRRINFSDEDQIFQSYRTKKIFNYLDDNYLHAYIQGIIKKDLHGNIKLSYNPEWEMRIYATGIWNDMDIWEGIATLKIPVLVIRGKESNTFFLYTARFLKTKLPFSTVINLNRSTHLVPLEKPNKVGSIIMKFLEENL